jgi:hypothetical protein
MDEYINMDKNIAITVDEHESAEILDVCSENDEKEDQHSDIAHVTLKHAFTAVLILKRLLGILEVIVL